MFILPFMKAWDPNASVDDAAMAFFAVNERKFYHGIAKRAFRMPGRLLLAGNRPTSRSSARAVVQGQYMLLAIDRVDQNARVDIRLGDKDLTFLLTRPELEYIKDQLEVKEV